MTPAIEAFLDLTGAEAPIIQAPMAGAGGVALATAAIAGGALGSLPCAMLSPVQAVLQAAEVRAAGEGPLNLNAFCHTLSDADDGAWRAVLAPFYAAEGIAPADSAPPLRRPFDAAMAEAWAAIRPEVASFHFGLPARDLLATVRDSGAVIAGNATSVAEAQWLVAHGADMVIAQGAEAGGHAGWFLDAHRPVRLAELLPAVIAAVEVPVIAAGGIVDARGVADALAAGAAAVQLGTLYLASPESDASAVHRSALGSQADTVFTTLFSGRAARGVRNRLIEALGPTHDAVPPFPHASFALAPLRRHAEAEGRGDYSPLWAGANHVRVRPEPAEALTRRLIDDVIELMETMR